MKLTEYRCLVTEILNFNVKKSPILFIKKTITNICLHKKWHVFDIKIEYFCDLTWVFGKLTLINFIKN